MPLRVLVIALGLLPGPPALAAQSLEVIVRADSEITELTEQEVRQIFTARRLRVGDQRIAVALNPDETEIYESLARTLTGRSTRSFGLLWLEAGFQRAAPEPKLVTDDEEMIRFVLSTPGAIGYTTGGDLPEGVRVVHRLLLDER